MKAVFLRVAVSGLLMLSSIIWNRAAEPERRLTLYWVDVEGGAATLIVTPEGESILIDSGHPGGRDSRRIHKVASEVAGLRQIDHLVTTHFHLDHFGGAAELSWLMPIQNVHDNGIPEQDPDGNSEPSRFLKNIQPYREFAAKQRSVITPGEKIVLAQPGPGKAKVLLKCLAARQSFLRDVEARSGTNTHCSGATVKTKAKDTSDNANSIVMLLEYGNFRFFNGGDLTWNTEAELVCPINRVGVVDVYQVDHHGLDVSNNPLLVRSLAPTVSIMSNGTQKGCGAETFATLKSVPSIQAMYQIHRNLRADEENNALPEHIANLEADCAANYIQLTVDPDGNGYTVSIPATGHRRTFRTQSR
jgi:beta-lactamase superfamily II metal-dependent hydrolase